MLCIFWYSIICIIFTDESQKSKFYDNYIYLLDVGQGLALQEEVFRWDSSLIVMSQCLQLGRVWWMLSLWFRFRAVHSTFWLEKLAPSKFVADVVTSGYHLPLLLYQNQFFRKIIDQL